MLVKYYLMYLKISKESYNKRQKILKNVLYLGTEVVLTLINAMWY